MNSLLKMKFNWLLFIGIAVLLKILLPGISWYSYLAILISLQQFILLFNAVDFIVPIRYLFGAFMCLQFFIGPMLAYNGLDQYQFIGYQMRIPEAEYFSYAIPAVCAFIIGLHISSRKSKGEILNEKAILDFVNQYPQLPFVFIAIGFFSSILSGLFSSELAFVFVLLGGFKFIGLFMIILGEKKLKILPVIVVVGSIISSSLSSGMFHDLLTWIIFTLAILAVKYKPRLTVKLTGTVMFILLAVLIQQTKGYYRERIWEEGSAGNLSTLANVYENNTNLFSLENLAANSVRINQGFILTNIMTTVPSQVPFSNGAELKQIAESAILPRILAPNKLNAGDRELFTKYSGIQIDSGTSMALSSLGDAYLNFGTFGGCIFMFFLGLLYSEVLKALNRKSAKFPLILLFTPLIFYYPIRPDCELQTILGHLVKSCFLVYVLFTFRKDIFRINSTVMRTPEKFVQV
ncbi:MAG TPA: hypothetical protein PLP23_13280 [Panacibacter sp.]|nr:hypothetical protein [Panacibacter sp.]